RLGLGQDAPGAGASRRRRDRHAPPLRGGLRAHNRGATLELAPASRRRPGLKARVLIRPKEGILDPQGQTVERALPALGFSGASATPSSSGTAIASCTAPTPW